MMKTTWSFGRVMGVATAIAFALAGCSAESNAQTVTVDIGGGVTMDMVWIAPGSFTMGQNNLMAEFGDWIGTTERWVTLTRGFHMGVHAVTQEQFYAVMGVNPSWFDGSAGWEPAEGEAQGKRPVENVNWYHAIAFANRLSILQGLEPVYSIAGMSNTDADAWLFENVPVDWGGPRRATWDAVTANWNANGFRLATEAEWEFAARAGTATEWSFGNNAANLGHYAWYGVCCCDGGMTRQVGQKRPNAWGLYDMHGNVWEWVWDLWGIPGTVPTTDPTGPAAGDFRVSRGGCWGYPSGSARSAIRSVTIPAERVHNIGFRVVRP